MNEIIKHAQQTFLAMKDPYHSVERVYPQAIHALEKHDDIHYTPAAHSAAESPWIYTAYGGPVQYQWKGS